MYQGMKEFSISAYCSNPFIFATLFSMVLEMVPAIRSTYLVAEGVIDVIPF
jgi:hypothetical protein